MSRAAPAAMGAAPAPALVEVEASADAGVLARMCDVFHQLGLPPPPLRVSVAGARMAATFDLGALTGAERAVVARKLAAIFGVERCGGAAP